MSTTRWTWTQIEPLQLGALTGLLNRRMKALEQFLGYLYGFAVVTVADANAEYFIRTSDRYIRAKNGAALVLPLSAVCDGLAFTIKCADESTVTIRTQNAEPIDGEPQIFLSGRSAVTLTGYGKGFDIAMSYIAPASNARVEMLIATLIKETRKNNLVLQQTSGVFINDTDVPDVDSALQGATT